MKLTLPIKIVLALVVAAGAWLLARKIGASETPDSPGTGAPSTGGNSLAENPSSNPFVDLFKSLTRSGTPATGNAAPAAPAKPTKPNRSASHGTARSPTRRRGVEGNLIARR
jgi:hypothetical protein